MQLSQNIYPLRWDTELDRHLLWAGHSTRPTHAVKEQVHRYHELIFNFSAIPLRHTAAGHSYISTTPFVLYRAPYLLHSTGMLEDDGVYRRVNVVFHSNIFVEFGGICELGRLGHHWECMIPATEEQMQAFLPLLERLMRSNDPSISKKLRLGTLAVLLCEVNELAEAAIPHEEGITAPPYIQDLLRYVVEHIAEPLTLDMLAERFFISRAKLTRDFRSAVKTSLHDYITAIRVQRAKILLEEGTPLSIVSQQCGFSRESAFITMFRHRTGLTPGEYRRSVGR